MDPVSMILALALQHPEVATRAANTYNTPGQIDSTKLEVSIADFAMQTLNCYHRTARFRGVDVVAVPWAEQSKFGAQASAVLRITFTGLSNQPYQMIVAAMANQRNYRTFVIGENSLVPYNKRCALENWTFAG
ncbi:hypothetical protein [Herbaspirillum huttiense]|uniref:hypothetical protein n=1 Tax=Herbaspirillum huttiense TaxID=863372 RepID=UPI0031E0750F